MSWEALKLRNRKVDHLSERNKAKNTQSQFYIGIDREGKNKGERPRKFIGLELRGLILFHYC